MTSSSEDVGAILSQRREEEQSRDPDELLAHDAARVAELLTGLAGGVVIETSDGRLESRDGAVVAASFHRPPNDEELLDLPPALPPEHVARWVAHYVGRPGHLTAAAFEILGHQGTWHAIALLEEPTVAPPPTDSLRRRIENHRIAIEVLEETAAEGKQVATDDTGKTFVAYPTHLVETGRLLYKRLCVLEGLLESRNMQVERLAGVATKTDDGRVGKSPRGGRGHWSGARRLLRYGLATKPLGDAGWSCRERAELAVESSTWAKPPCRRYIADLLDRAENDRARAVGRLAGALKKTLQRADR